ncbi:MULTISPECIES: DNA internalization-related competence protein ComEC/Rec2 [unclassified Acinetobacter]|uniref:DNA internalization-related competence protein ComEC/Rec2 n=1 Tax=unclassified Acinetobacter TaxID=196816 RepID=UPI001909D176|nr:MULTISPECIES: DNA internalization-related competence protein ComEC/Rec2 [unclassified Acinetobacter]MBK0063646.1 DNA internalization-related competence protein ComEC/Rec2 [Acinetobacter sp. S55]MBK0067524.1 DNA internalization-related competence protein ComEC/Rec2 [Acinetobacter sp. S54]
MLKIILLGWIIGIAMMGYSFQNLTPIIYYFIPFVLMLWGIYFLKKATWSENISAKTILTISSTFLMWLLGYLYADYALLERLKQKEITSTASSEVIYIREMGQSTDHGIKQPVEILSQGRPSVVWLVYIDDRLLESIAIKNNSLELGQYYQVKGIIKPVHGYANAGGFDQEKWFIQQNWMSGFHVQQIQSLSTQDVYRLGFQQHLKQKQALWRRFCLNIEQLRLDFRGQLHQQPFKYKALMLALLTGDRSLLDKNTEILFQRFGISHLLAISGPHVLILAALFTWLMSCVIHKLKPTLYLKYPRQILMIIPFCSCVFIYTAFVGFEIPALRTLLLTIIASLFLLVKHEIRAFSLLIYTASLSLLIDPFSILSAAFWLSYGACFILLNIYQSMHFPTTSVLTLMQKIWKNIQLLIQSQWKIFIALLPLVLIFFKQVSWISPIANLIVIPLLGGVIVPLGIIAACVWLIIPTIGHLLFQINDLLIGILFFILNGLDHLFNPVLYTFALTPWILLSIGLGILMLFLPKGSIPKSWALLCICPIFLLTWVKRDTQISVIDVGQGQSIFIQDSSQRLLIDTGGYYDETKFSIGQNVVVPYLKQQGVAQLDRILLSHLDQDHSGALEAILKQVKVTHFMANETLPQQNSMSFSKCYTGQTWQTPDIRLHILSPEPIDDQLVQSNRNEHSCVVYLELLKAKGLRRFLIMGDAGWETEYQILQKYPDLKVDVLVLGHHGSKHSSSYDFLRHYQPQLTVASVGYSNRYGHPSTQTLSRLDALNIPLYTTIASGTITFRVQNNQVQVEQYRKIFKWLNRDEP